MSVRHSFCGFDWNALISLSHSILCSFSASFLIEPVSLGGAKPCGSCSSERATFASEVEAACAVYRPWRNVTPLTPSSVQYLWNLGTGDALGGAIGLCTEHLPVREPVVNCMWQRARNSAHGLLGLRDHSRKNLESRTVLLTCVERQALGC
jgi:hypothetical protein